MSSASNILSIHLEFIHVASRSIYVDQFCDDLGFGNSQF